MKTAEEWWHSASLQYCGCDACVKTCNTLVNGIRAEVVDAYVNCCDDMGDDRIARHMESWWAAQEAKQ